MTGLRELCRYPGLRGLTASALCMDVYVYEMLGINFERFKNLSSVLHVVDYQGDISQYSQHNTQPLFSSDC